MSAEGHGNGGRDWWEATRRRVCIQVLFVYRCRPRGAGTRPHELSLSKLCQPKPAKRTWAQQSAQTLH